VIRFPVRTLVLLLANAAGLLVANIVLDGMDLDAAAFIIDVVIFTVALSLMTPFVANQLRKRQSSALGGVALIATLIALIITDLISDGLTIDGIGTWIAATVIVGRRSSSRRSSCPSRVEEVPPGKPALRVPHGYTSG
jgi:putative membrane protein